MDPILNRYRKPTNSVTKREIKPSRKVQRYTNSARLPGKSPETSAITTASRVTFVNESLGNRTCLRVSVGTDEEMAIFVSVSLIQSW